MTCGSCVAVLVECARDGLGAPVSVQAHLRGCPRCQERFDSERSLGNQLRAIRIAALVRTGPNTRKQDLLREFARAHRRRVPRKFAIGIGIAAMLAVAAGLVWKGGDGPLPAPVERASVSQVIQDESGYVAVPYALPLAEGEFVRVVRTPLRPVALARMGFDVALTDSGDISADVLLGEDGFPRAVRVPGMTARY